MTVLIGLAAVLLAGLALGVLGSFLPGVPYLGLATGFVPPVMTWVIIGAVVIGACATYLWWRRRGWLTGALVAVAVLTVIGATVVTARMMAAVEHAGADVDLVDTLGVWVKDVASPDAEATYTTFDGEPLKLDVYRPPGSSADSRAPVLVYVHGGGWVAGSRAAHSADMRWFAEQGWLVVALDYSLSSEERHLWDVVQGQLGCALAWVATNAPAYGGDPARLSSSGDSAGGNLAINTAYLSASGALKSSCGGTLPEVAAVSTLYPAVDPAGLFTNDSELSGTSRAMVTSYTGGSPQDFPERYAAVTSATHLSAAAPPTLIIVGEADHLVPTEGTYRFAEAAGAAGVDVELVAVPHLDHVFDARAGSIGQQAYRQLTAKWLREHGQAPEPG